ncbi:SHUGOSHIN 1-like isoform X2 [Juglans microcarpa x Juglans regia]|uniref:SHUGOSHIN 1-like isoform X2 n=1 Tax=Juglans microcarpa x Juglans regia TaxID=2249226 RepID=UPI001B7F5A0B|nr:SHUGOSHIN 1-like isoform X2 [Juglans microcarpa x Juglans regia]
MDVAIVLDSEICVAGNDRIKGAKGPKIGSAPRKRLADISNLQKQPKPVNQDVNQLPFSLTAKEYIEKLQKENVTLMKLVVERNKIIELSRIELQKLRISLQKVQQQNLQLAQANSQMLAELNSGKDRLKALQHELGCKNGLLKAQKLDSEIKAKRVTLQNSGNEVAKTKHDEAGESAQTAGGDSNTCHKNRRRRQSKNQSLGPATGNQINNKETVENKRNCLRRQSARFKSEEPEPSEDCFVTDRDSGPTTLKPVLVKQDIGNKRHCLRRQSARFKSEEPERNEDLFEIDDAKFPASPPVDDVHDSSQITSELPVKKEDEGVKAQEIRRSSVGRPLRRAVEKVQCYKEIPLRMKMRRQE